MMNRKRVFWATTALFTGLMAAGAASAQSTGTEATEVESVVVTGSRGPANVGGLATAETIAKTRNTVGQEFIATQAAGQTILQTLNLTPGLSFTNVLRSLPPDADLDALKALVAPIVDKVSEIKRVEGGRVD